MKVVLLKSVAKLGTQGEVRVVSPGYARNFLFPKSLAVPATGEVLQRTEHVREKREEDAVHDLEQTERIAERLDGLEVEMTGKANESGTLFAAVTTSASCGAVNSMHDSYTPLGGTVPLINMMCDGVIFGGVGAGLYGMLMYAIIAVFLAGLMVGRTPEYVGKKIEKFEVRMAILAVLLLFGNVVF